MIQDQIKGKWGEFSNAQIKIAQYVLNNMEEAAFMTAEKLAEACDVSEASIIRFAIKMGFSRYAELQTEMRISMRGHLYQIDRLRRVGNLRKDNTTLRIVAKSMQLDMKSIEKTLLNIKESTLQSVVEDIAQAKNVFVVGTHSVYCAASYFAVVLGWIRKDVFIIDETHSLAFDRIADMDDRDVLIAIGFPPYAAFTVYIVEDARRKGAQCIGITDSPLSPIATRANEVIYIHEEKIFFTDNLAATISLLSALLLLISSYDYEATEKLLEKRQKYWEEIGYYHKEDR